MSTTKKLPINNTYFIEYAHYLDDDARAELLRLEKIEKCLYNCLNRDEDTGIRPLTQLANLLLEYNAAHDSDPSDESMAYKIYNIHYQLSKIEALLIQE